MNIDKNKGGRPRKQIDRDLFERLCGLQCSLEEISFALDCSEDTVERWCKREYNASFADVYKKHSASGKISLRRYQFELAKKSAAMAIFLGKQYLGQSDEPKQADVHDDPLIDMLARWDDAARQ